MPRSLVKRWLYSSARGNGTTSPLKCHVPHEQNELRRQRTGPRLRTEFIQNVCSYQIEDCSLETGDSIFKLLCLHARLTQQNTQVRTGRDSRCSSENVYRLK
jgi:hypothetical protein